MRNQLCSSLERGRAVSQEIDLEHAVALWINACRIGRSIPRRRGRPLKRHLFLFLEGLRLHFEANNFAPPTADDATDIAEYWEINDGAGARGRWESRLASIHKYRRLSLTDPLSSPINS
jgi:hypothetical protein